MDHGGEEVAGECQLVLDEPQEVEGDKSQNGIENGRMSVGDDPFGGGKGRVRQCVKKRQGQPSELQGGPEKAGDRLQRKDDGEKGKIDVAAQTIVSGIGIRDRTSRRIGGRFHMKGDLFPEDGGESLSLVAGIEILPPGKGGAPEGQVKTGKNQKNEEVAQDDVRLLEKDRLRLGEAEELMVVEDEVGEDEQGDDEQVCPVPEAQPSLPDGKFCAVAIGVAAQEVPVVHNRRQLR